MKGKAGYLKKYKRNFYLFNSQVNYEIFVLISMFKIFWNRLKLAKIKPKFILHKKMLFIKKS